METRLLRLWSPTDTGDKADQSKNGRQAGSCYMRVHWQLLPSASRGCNVAAAPVLEIRIHQWRHEQHMFRATQNTLLQHGKEGRAHAPSPWLRMPIQSKMICQAINLFIIWWAGCSRQSRCKICR